MENGKRDIGGLIEKETIDGGKAFDWGRTSGDYAKYRDIYPPEFYEYLLQQEVGIKGQRILDIGTGTGVLPRNLYRYGGKFTGLDISENQIAEAKLLAQKEKMEIDFFCSPAEQIEFGEASFDAVTACQCFQYFDHQVLAPKIHNILKESGKFMILYMAWLPFEDEIANLSENLVLKYNPKWNGCKETRHSIEIPEIYRVYFEVEKQDVFDVQVPFTRDSWHGRMKSCRGIGASLTDEEIRKFEQEHRMLLADSAPEEFCIKHYIAAATLRKR